MRRSRFKLVRSASMLALAEVTSACVVDVAVIWAACGSGSFGLGDHLVQPLPLLDPDRLPAELGAVHIR